MISVKRILLPLFFSIAVFNTSAQVKFQRTYGIGLYNEGRSVKQTFDGGYIIAGSESVAGNGAADFYLLKIDSLGNFMWHKTFGGNNIDRSYSVEQLNDSGYVLCGYTNSFGSGGYDGYLVRTDKNGDTLWTKTYGTPEWDFIYALKKTFDGGFVMAGNSYGFNSTGNPDILIVKTDSLGNSSWIKNYGGDSAEVANSILQTSDSGFIITGNTSSFGSGGKDIYVLRTDFAGDTLWTKTYGGSGDDFGQSIKQTTDTGYIIGAYSNSFTAGDYNEYLVKTNLNGDILWTRNTGGVNDEIINDIIALPDGRFSYAGKFNGSGGGGFDFRIANTSSDGWFNWGYTFGSIGDDEAFHLEMTSDSGFIAVGLIASSGSGTKVFIVKTDSSGISDSSIVNNIAIHGEINKNFFDCPQVFYARNQMHIKSAPGIQAGKKTLLRIYDFQAKLVETQRVIPGDSDLNLKPLVNGIYFYIVTTNEGIVCTGKFSVVE